MNDPAGTMRGRIEGGRDAVVIGATVDGLIAATLLAKAGLKTVLLDGAAGLGGAAATRSFAPGLRVSDEAHLLYALDRDVVRDLDLYRHGLSFSVRRLPSLLLSPTDDPVVLTGDMGRAKEDLAARLPDDAEAFDAFAKAMGDHAEALSFVFALAGGKNGLSVNDPDDAIAKINKEIGEDAAAQLPLWATASVRQMLDGVVQSDLLKGALAFDAVFGTAVGPRAPMSFAGLLRRWAGESGGARAALAHPTGGMGEVTEALRRAAQAAKVEIRTNTPVCEVLLEWDVAAGVQLDDGGQIRADTVISALDARTTFLDLIGPGDLNTGVHASVDRPLPPVFSAKLHLAFSKPPIIAGVKETDRASRFLLCPSLNYLDEAFRYAKYGRMPARLAMEFILPDALDEGLADPGRHSLSAWVHPLPARLQTATDMEAARQEIITAALGTLGRVMPDVAKLTTEAEVRLPQDYAADYGQHEAAWRAGRPLPDQWLQAVKLTDPDWADGFFFCGREASVGGGVSGAAGRRVAQAALRRVKSRSSLI